MAFDWPQFLDQQGIEFISRGRDNIGISCTLCADYDHHHLVISTEGKGWHCWKNPTHKGKSPAGLIMVLLGCSYEEASRLAISENISFAKSDDTFADDALRRLGLIVKPPRLLPGKLEFLPEFTHLKNSGLCRTLAVPYLVSRGYTEDGVLWLGDRYKLMFAARGPFAYRIIIPVIVNKKVVNWTGRTVAENEKLRYKSLSTDPDKAAQQGLPAATSNIKECLLDYDNIVRGGELLVVTEGPFDAIRIGFLGEREGIRSTCLFGKAATPTQIDLLAQLAPRYNEIIALFDQDAGFDAFLTMPDYLSMRPMYLPQGCGDPAELSQVQFNKMFY